MSAVTRGATPWWLMLASSIGYAAALVLVGIFLNDRTVTVASATIFLVPSLLFGALIAQWWAAAVPMLFGVIAVVVDFLIVCETDCLGDALGDLPTVLVFAIPSVFAVLIGVALRKAIRSRGAG